MPSPYELRFFQEGGFTRQQCPTCGRAYWSLETHPNCGETPCQEYVFIGASPMGKRLDLRAMREAFLAFFENRDHTRITRYPVVARWRDDVFYTQASVIPFQPWVVEGLAQPPANPLVLSQPCVRFNDIDNVGRTGQHFTLFEMMAHHVFNYKGKPIYFRERTTELCHAFMTEELGIPPGTLRYVESDWAGGGYSGPCFEVTADGAELATLVFMMYRGENPDDREPLGCRVVDTGYGLERLTWVSQGSPSAYEAVFGEVLETLKTEAEVETDSEILAAYSKVAGGMNVETHGDVRRLRQQVAARAGVSVKELMAETLPLEDLYALCDHSRALAFVLGDGVVPSNVKEGYFARLLVRRALRALGRRELKLSLDDLVGMQIAQFAQDYPELRTMEEEIRKLVRVEEGKYRETLKKGRKIVVQLGERIDVEELVQLYDSHGLVPEVVQEFAEGEVEIPDDFFTLVAERHLDQEPRSEARRVPEGLPSTKLLFYDDPRRLRFQATVLGLHEGHAILDRTYFYPEGGGQEADTGRIGKLRVTDVQLAGGVVLHRIEGEGDLEVGRRVRCQVDEGRRLRLMRHHTATHIVNGASRAVLGQHVWQAGAHKSEEHATLDITHYANLTVEELRAVETLANRIVMENRPVHQGFEPREEAEAQYGFGLYQGGSIPGKLLRVVNIEDFDVEACGGTHLFRTGETGMIKLLGSRRIQDGVVRLQYVAGEAALDHVREQESAVREASRILRSRPDDLPQAAERLQAERKSLTRKVERMEAQRTSGEVEDLLEAAEEIGEVRLVVHEVKGGTRTLIALAKELLARPGVVCVLGGRDGTASLVLGRSDDVDLDVSVGIQKAASILGGKGGGKPDFAQGGGPHVEKLEKAADRAASWIRERLQA